MGYRSSELQDCFHNRGSTGGLLKETPRLGLPVSLFRGQGDTLLAGCSARDGEPADVR